MIWSHNLQSQNLFYPEHALFLLQLIIEVQTSVKDEKADSTPIMLKKPHHLV